MRKSAGLHLQICRPQRCTRANPDPVIKVRYDAHADAEWVSSALLRIEVIRAVARATPALLPDARDLLLAFSCIAIDDDIVEGAMNEPDRGLRSLDAIHLATARILAPDLDALVTYDDRLLGAATEAGLAAISPRD